MRENELGKSVSYNFKISLVASLHLISSLVVY